MGASQYEEPVVWEPSLPMVTSISQGSRPWKGPTSGCHEWYPPVLHHWVSNTHMLWPHHFVFYKWRLLCCRSYFWGTLSPLSLLSSSFALKNKWPQSCFDDRPGKNAGEGEDVQSMSCRGTEHFEVMIRIASLTCSPWALMQSETGPLTASLQKDLVYLAGSAISLLRNDI